MSNLIPMVSSSPPPMDDGGFGWDDDDDDFGTFTGADDSTDTFQDATGGEQLTKSHVSAGVTEKAEADTWHQSNGQVIQEPQEQVDGNFAIFPDDAEQDNTSDTNEIVETRPSKIEISSELGNQTDGTTTEEIKDDYKGPLTDSGLYSADISPVQNCDNLRSTSIKEQDDSDSLEVSLPDLSPASINADSCSSDVNFETETRTDTCEDVQSETKSEILVKDGSNQHEQSEVCEVEDDSKEEEEEDKSCSSEEKCAADPSEHSNIASQTSSHSDTTQCDNDIPPHENVCTNTILVTDRVQDTTAQDQQPSDSSEEGRLSDTERTSPVTGHCDSISDSCHQDDGSTCSELNHVENTDNDLRNSNDTSSPPKQQVMCDSLSNSISDQENDEDFGDFESMKDEQIPASKSIEDIDVSLQKDTELSNESCNADSTAAEATNPDSTNPDTDDWGEFDTGTGGADISPGGEAKSEHIESLHSDQEQENNVCNDDTTSDASETSDNCSGEEEKSDKNNSFSQVDNEIPNSSAIEEPSLAVHAESETREESSKTSVDDKEDFGNFNGPTIATDFPNKCDTEGGDDFGKFQEDGIVNEDDDFGNFNEASDTTDIPVTSECDKSSADDFGTFQDNVNVDEDDDFGNFDKADEFGSFDQGPNEFAAFGDSTADAEKSSEAKTDWASFSEPQIVEMAELPAEDEDDDEWAAFSEEPAPAATPVTAPVTAPVSPSAASQPPQQKMSQQEKLLLAVTTVFPGQPADGDDEETAATYPTLVTDLNGLVTEGQGEVSVWLQIKAVQATNALTYQYAKSGWNERLFHTLHVDTRNVLIGHKKAPVPAFASGLTLLEPTKGPAAPLQPDVLVDTSKAPESVPQTQEAIPPAQFDWSTSGLKNPLEEDNKTLNLDFLIQDQAIKSNALESEFLGDSSFAVPSKPAASLQPLETILASMRHVSTVRGATPQDDGAVSGEARNIVSTLPSLSFMKSKVLMFPLKLDQ